MKELNSKIEKNEKLQELLAELDKVDKQIDVQTGKFETENQILNTDKQILSEQKAKKAKALHEAEIEELKQLQTSITALEQDTEKQFQLVALLADTVDDLNKNKSELKRQIEQLLKLIIEHFRVELETTKGAAILNSFLKLNDDYANASDALFKKHGLKTLSFHNRRLTVRGSFEFLMFLRYSNTTPHFKRDTAIANDQFYENQLKKLQRGIDNFGKKSPTDTDAVVVM